MGPTAEMGYYAPITKTLTAKSPAMNHRCDKSKIYQSEIYWENSAIRTFPNSYRFRVSDQARVINLTELEAQRFQEVQLRKEFETSKSLSAFRSLAAILFGSLTIGFVGCSSELEEHAAQDIAPAAKVESIEPAPAASSFGNNDLRIRSGRSLPLPPAMEYGS